MKYMSRCVFLITFISLFFPINTSATAINGFDAEKQEAIFISSDWYFGKKSRERRVLYVDFSAEEIIEIAGGRRISSLSANLDEKVAWFRRNNTFSFYDLEENTTAYKYDSLAANLILIEDKLLVAGIDNARNKFVVINPQEGLEILYPYNGEFLWGVGWNSECECVYFELSEDGASEHYLVQEKNGALVRVKGQRFLLNNAPPGFVAYFKEGETDDVPVSLFVKSQKETAAFYAAGPMTRDKMLWSKNTLRLLDSSALLDLATLELMKRSSSLWKDNRSDTPLIIDLASDPNGYVLKWNMDKKIFEVESILTGRVVKTYSKFW